MAARRSPQTEPEIDFFQLMEDRRLETEQHIEKLHIRINGLKDELYEEIADSHKEIMHEIKEMKQEQREHAVHESQILEKLDNRLTNLESMRWLIIGGGAAVAWLLLGGLEAIKEFLA